ncbi:MAG: hypothetical protein JRN15_09995, partial [Nitrososphaerota archaeon]|nr:hypothetical protein [Nitrososphaerota archaeon]
VRLTGFSKDLKVAVCTSIIATCVRFDHFQSIGLRYALTNLMTRSKAQTPEYLDLPLWLGCIT